MSSQKVAVGQPMAERRPNYPRLFLFIAMGLMTLLVIGYEIYFSIHYPARLPRLLSMKWLLIPHILFSTIGFVVGPLQFSSRLRKRNLRLHRTLGKVYVFSILLGATFALAITCVYPPKNGNFMVENIAQGVIWLLTTIVAWLAIRNRQIDLHKTWMARSYSVTFIFILSRVFAPLPFFQQMSVESGTSYMWFLIVFSLIVPDLLVNGNVLLTTPKKRVAPHPNPN